MLSYDLLGDLAQRLLWMLRYMRRDRITVEVFRRAAVVITKFKPFVTISESDREVYHHVRGFLSSFLDSCVDWDWEAALGQVGEIFVSSLIECDRLNEFHIGNIIELDVL